MMENFEEQLKDQLQNDQLPFSADPAIKTRLRYHMDLKASRAEVRKNSILPFTTKMFTQKFVAWQLGIVTILLIFFAGYNQYKHNHTYTQVVDTTHSIISIDTTSILLGDSLLIH